MSSFKKKSTGETLPGSLPSPFGTHLLVSTGLEALDDLLGGGLPLGSLTTLESDFMTSYAELVLKYFISQGLEHRHTVVFSSAVPPEDVTAALMGNSEGASMHSDEDEAEPAASDEQLKIAFRYQDLKQHQTGLARAQMQGNYCSTFDLTQQRKLTPRDPLYAIACDGLTLPELYDRIEQELARRNTGIARIAIHSLPPDTEDLYWFLLRIKSLIHNKKACVMVNLELDKAVYTRTRHVSDAVVQIESFGASPHLQRVFPRHNGFMRILKLPSGGSLVAPGLKLSTLRVLGGDTTSIGSNLGFRVKRRRFVIETLVIDEVVGSAAPDAPDFPTPAPKEPPKVYNKNNSDLKSALKTKHIQIEVDDRPRKSVAFSADSSAVSSLVQKTNSLEADTSVVSPVSSLKKKGVSFDF